MLKALTIAAWVLFAIDALAVIAGAAVSRSLSLGLGMASAAFLLIGGGVLYFGGRAQSTAAIAGSLIFLGLPSLPALWFFGADLEAAVHRASGWVSDRKVGRYPDPAQRELAIAIRAGDTAAMEKILGARPSLSGRDEAGNDLLGFAVSESRTLDTGVSPKQRMDAVRLLLEAGMNPNQARDIYGGSTWVVLSRGLTDPANAEIFRMFLDHGADANALDTEGTPVIFNAWENLDCLRAMLDHGARVDIRSKDGNTPLLFFTGNGRWDAAMLMLDRGADIDVQNENGVTLAMALDNRKAMAERLQEPLAEGYAKLKAAIERRRSAGSK